MKLDGLGLSKQEVFIVKWQYGFLGDFGQALAKAISLADKTNIERLRLGFPNEVAGYEAYTQQAGWWQRLQEKISMEGT